jgi:GGDEF domain-containing protein
MSAADILAFAIGILIGVAGVLVWLRSERLSVRAIRRGDRLTGCRDRWAFHRYLKGSPRGAFLLLDLDHFKLINDAAGTEAGNEALRQVGRELRAVAKRNKVFRVGGDEFIVLLPRADLGQAHALAVTIAERIAVIGAQWPFYGESPGFGATVVSKLWDDEPASAWGHADIGITFLKNLRDMRAIRPSRKRERVLNVTTVGEFRVTTSIAMPRWRDA